MFCTMQRCSSIHRLLVFPLPFLLLLVHLTAASDESLHRLRRSPAIWGAPAPDYASIADTRDGQLRYLYTVLFVDSKIMEYYDNDFLKAKRKVMRVVEEANRYLIQLSTAVTVVEIYPMMRADFSLYSFQEFRNQRVEAYRSHHSARRSAAARARSANTVLSPHHAGHFSHLHKLPDHDFAALFTYKYAGGLAFVDGMCSPQSVMLCGFFPSDPKAMGGIFFHEIAHLLGVPHRPQNSTIDVPNCACPSQEEQDRRRRSISRPSSNDVVNDPGCLKIPGFDHDCTAQQFINYLHTSKCAREQPLEIMKSNPICGNRVTEEGEQCDCGIAEVCSRWNCVPETCQYRLHPVWLWLIAFVLSLLAFSVFSFLLHRRGFLSMFTSCYKKKRSKSASAYASTLLTDDFLKSPMTSQLGRKVNAYAHNGRLDSSSSVVVLLDAPPRVAGLPPPVPTLSRPKTAPPPPPPKTRIAVQSANHHGYEIPIKRGGAVLPYTLQCHPSSALSSPPSADPDSISWKFDSFDSDEDDLRTIPSVTGVPCRPSYPYSSPINRVVVSEVPSESDATLSTDCPSSSSSGDVKL
ncbi:hypothetical protein PENTCL1PPCAC_25088 [Pristionchus entomophagus]|uniref:Peptidase M12B domain-containing protein n=1 Tax=Pristionchus entomophagus TaxID=358040 RepID=A0AAV5U7T1_9BILA|nr:hypothetical protein PENTCL1PPCAC_25088 [Pristionchus entomophagus]